MAGYNQKSLSRLGSSVAGAHGKDRAWKGARTCLSLTTTFSSKGTLCEFLESVRTLSRMHMICL